MSDEVRVELNEIEIEIAKHIIRVIPKISGTQDILVICDWTGYHELNVLSAVTCHFSSLHDLSSYNGFNCPLHWDLVDCVVCMAR